jgi:hypothetical protein
MRQIISFRLFLLAATLKWATDIENVPEMFRALATFLEKEPDENFSLFDKRIPLSVNEKSLSSLQKVTSKFPEVIEIGKAQSKRFDSPLNIVITIGQLLSTVSIIFDFYARPINPDLKEKYKNVEPLVKKFDEIWSSHMNGHQLAEQYANKNAKESKTNLAKKLNESADLIEKRILPEIKVGQK